MSEFTVYIIRNKEGRYYIGHTANFEDRLLRHNEGRSTYTKGKGPWSPVVQVNLSTKSEAYQLELKLKKMKNAKKAIEYLRDHKLVVEHSD